MDKPIYGQQYRLIGKAGEPSIAHGNTWAESKVEKKENWEEESKVLDKVVEAMKNDMKNKKRYTLIVGHGFSISNDTDADVMTDYFPGIWAISSYKRAIKYAKEYLAQGNEVRVTTYDNPEYAKLGNKAIAELGNGQELFPEPVELERGTVTNGKPSNLAQLKKYLQPGVKLRVHNFRSSLNPVTKEWEQAWVSRETHVLATQTNAVVLEKDGKKSWLEYDKASNWTFSDEGATKHYVERSGPEKGKYKPTTRIEYLA